MAWDDQLSCGHYGGYQGARHICVCSGPLRHTDEHHCTCGEEWANALAAV